MYQFNSNTDSLSYKYKNINNFTDNENIFRYLKLLQDTISNSNDPVMKKAKEINVFKKDMGTRSKIQI